MASATRLNAIEVTRMRKKLAQWVAGWAVSALLLGAAAPSLAHHSYAVFDLSHASTVDGTVAKVEWNNPHITIWVYVPRKSGSGYELYGFEGGGVNLSLRQGWRKDSLKTGEKVTVEYFALKDGRPGGAFIKATHADGTITGGDRLLGGAAKKRNINK